MQTWKTRFRRIAAMVCTLALCASLLPAGALANNTDGIDVDESSSSQVVTGTEPTSDETLTEETTDGQNTEPAKAARGVVVGGKTVNSTNEIFSVEYYEGLATDLRSNLTVIAVDQDNQEIDRAEIGAAYRAGWTMTITLNDAYKTAYELVDVTGADGVNVSDWSGDFNDAQSSTFTWSDNGDNATIYLHIAEASHVIELKNDTVDLGTITWKEGGKQLTTVEAYLNYELVYTSEPLNISNALNNFALDVNDGYYFDTVNMQDIKYSSNIAGQTFTYNSLGDYNKLVFGMVPSLFSGNNTIKLYFFNYENGIKTDFTRAINENLAAVNADAACDTLNISFSYADKEYSFPYTDFSQTGAVYLPKDTYVTVEPVIKDGYHFEYWRSGDAWTEGNNLYTIKSDGSWTSEITGAAGLQDGRIAFSETMGLRYSAAGFNRAQIILLMTDGGLIEDPDTNPNKKITYDPNYEGGPDAYVQYYYYTTGAMILDNMFEREGYEFQGWNTAKDGSGTPYAADTIYEYDEISNLILYAQWKKIDEPSEDPHEPTDKELDGLLKDAIKIVCIDNTSHEELLSDLLDQGKPENESYKVDYTEGSTTATVTINRTESYVNAYETAYPTYGEHEYKIKDGVTDVTIELKWENGAWALDETIPAATITLSCDTTSSTTPSEPEISTLNSLLDVGVTCQNNPNHSKEFAELLDGSYVISTPTMGKENYECTVTITADSYIAQMAGEHKIVGEGSKDVLLAYVNDQWIVANKEEATVSFLAECVAPEAPDNTTVAGLLKDVTVTCDEHNSKTYDIDNTTITVDKSSLGYDANNEAFAIEVSVAAETYVDKYNDDFGPHTLNDTKSKTVTLLYQNGSWGLANKDAKVEFKVKCDTPDKPEYDDIAGLLGDVTVTCDVHGTGTYELSDGNYEVGSIQGGGYGALVKVTVFGAAYVDKFEADHNNIAHKLVGSEQITISLVYQKNGWMIDSSDLGKTIAFQVTCKPDAPTTDEVDALKIKNAVTLDCINTSVNHADVTYDLLKDSIITIGEVYGGTGSESYKVDLTIGPAYYVREYDMSTGMSHTWNGSDTGKITLSWDAVNNTWTAEEFAPIVFRVKCSTVTVPGDGGNNNDTPKDEHPDIAEGIANGTWGGTPTPTPAASATSTIPQTSDSMPIGLLAGTAAIAAAAIALLLVLRKRRQQ